MHRPDQSQADPVPGVMNTVRFETSATRARRATARIDSRLAMLVVAMLTVFACFFVIGRATDTRSARAEASSSVTIALNSAAIPIALSGAPPIETPSAAGAHARISRRSQSISTQTVSAPAQTVVHEVSRAPLRSPQLAQPVASRPEKAPSPPASASPPSTSGSSGTGGGHATPSSSGGGSFDSSG